MNIQVEERTNYGSKRYYPVSADSEMLCRLLKQRSLTSSNLKLLAGYGHSIQVLPSNPQLNFRSTS